MAISNLPLLYLGLGGGDRGEELQATASELLLAM